MMGSKQREEKWRIRERRVKERTIAKSGISCQEDVIHFPIYFTHCLPGEHPLESYL